MLVYGFILSRRKASQLLIKHLWHQHRTVSVGREGGKEWGHYIKRLVGTPNKNRLSSDRSFSVAAFCRAQNKNFPFLGHVAAAWSMSSVTTQASPQTFGASWGAVHKRCHMLLLHRQNLPRVSPGLRLASAFGGQSLFISRTSFRSTVQLQKDKTKTKTEASHYLMQKHAVSLSHVLYSRVHRVN